MFTLLEWETESNIAQKKQYPKQTNRNIKQMKTEKQVRTGIIW